MKERLKSSAILIACIGLVVLSDSMTGTTLTCGFAIALFLVLACAEFKKLCEKLNIHLPILTLIISIPALFFSVIVDFHCSSVIFSTVTVAAFIAVAVFLELMQKDSGARTVRLSLVFFSFFYIVFAGSFLYRIRLLDGGLFLLTYTIAAVKVTDTGALLSGRIFGRHRLVSSISPNKTVEGLIGGIVAGMLFSLLAHNLFAPGRFSNCEALFFGLAITIASVYGDLLESMIKRDAGIKDSGIFAPGLGGVLDIMDSLLVGAPVAYCFFLFH